MVRVLLVDDEKLIRDGLRNGIDWEELGCQIAGEAENGEDALNLMGEEKPDLVISDIRMPRMDGLELMDRARGIHHDIRFVFISGHDEFSYVQKALKLGASDYILKPLDMVYLEDKIASLARGIRDRNNRDGAERISLRSRTRQFLQTAVLENRQDDRELLAGAEQAGIDLNGKCFRVLSLQIDRYYHLAGSGEVEMDDVRRSFFGLRDFFNREKAYVLTQSLREYDLCLLGGSEEQLVSEMKESLIASRLFLEGQPFTVSIGIGEPTAHSGRIAESYNQAREALEMKFLKGDNRTIEYGEVVSFRSRKEEIAWEKYSDGLNDALRRGDSSRISILLDDLGKLLGKSENPRTVLNWITSDTLLRTSRLMEERSLSVEEVMEDPLEEWRTLNRLQTAEAILDRLEEILQNLARHINTGKGYHSSIIQNQVVEEIRSSFDKRDYSLEKAAAGACMSPSYFAVIFKQETGMTFNRFLTKIRMDRAKDLILYSDKRSYEIGPLVGYENPSYFSTAFKKATGMSPSEYRKNYS